VREVAGGVDGGFPSATLERREVLRPVATDLLDLGEELRVGLAAVGELDVMPRSSAASTVARPRNFVPPKTRIFTFW